MNTEKLIIKMIEEVVDNTPCNPDPYDEWQHKQDIKDYERHVEYLYEFQGEILDNTDRRYKKALEAIDRNEDEIYILYVYINRLYYYFDKETLKIIKTERAEPGYFKIENANAYALDNIMRDFHFNYDNAEFTLIDENNTEHKITMTGTITEAIQEFSKELKEDIYINDIKIKTTEEIYVDDVDDDVIPF